MSYLVRVTCPICCRDYRYKNDAPENERDCPFADCRLEEHETRVTFDGSHWRWFCSCGAKGIRLAYRSQVERLAAQHVEKVSA